MPDKNAPLWKFIPLNEYKSPSGPATETVRNHLQAILRRLRLSDRADQMDAFSEHDRKLKSIPDFLIERAAPKPDWRALHFESLTHAYHAWLNADSQHPGSHVLVNAPRSHLPQSARDWAADNKCHVVEPPTLQQILNNDPSWLTQVKAADGKRWVLPSLERCFLRHQNGLNLLRSWLDWAEEQPAGLIICDSWAWAFLSNTLHLDQILSPARTLEPLDAGALTRWFGRPVDQNSQEEYTFRQADSGKLIYVSGNSNGIDKSEEEGDRDKGNRNTQDESDYLERLAARSRGIPELAWHIWKQSLLVESDGDVEETAEEKAIIDEGTTIWIRPWDQLQLPAALGQFGLNEALVLHALLLHNGLPDSILPLLLPMLPSAIAGSIKQLQTANLIADYADCRRVSRLGYVAVRGFLGDEGFLTDDL